MKLLGDSGLIVVRSMKWQVQELKARVPAVRLQVSYTKGLIESVCSSLSSRRLKADIAIRTPEDQ